MRKLLIVLFALAVQTATAQYEIKMAINGLTDTTAYLGYHLGQNKYVQDTSEVNGGEIVFKGEASLEHGIYFLYTASYFLEFVITDEQQFTLESDMSDPLGNKKITGSQENEIFHQFQLKLAETQEKSMGLRESLKEANNREDSIGIFNEIASVDKANAEFQEKLAQENPDSYVATLVSLIKKPGDVEIPEGMSEREARIFKFNHYKSHFLEGIDFTYTGILRTPLFYSRIEEYMERLTSPEPDSIMVAADYMISKAENNPDVFRYVVVTLTNKYAQTKMMGHDAVFVHLAENYYLSGKAHWADEAAITRFEKAVDDLRPNLIGETAPSLQLMDTTLSPISLEDIDARYTLLFFYDPDCGHCKKVAPLALDFYHQYRNEGLEAIGVCVPTDVDKWKNFINEKALDWINAADPYLRSNFRKEYNITSFPTIYVLDENKKIIGKRIAVEQLSDFIEARMRLDGD